MSNTAFIPKSERQERSEKRKAAREETRNRKQIRRIKYGK